LIAGGRSAGDHGSGCGFPVCSAAFVKLERVPTDRATLTVLERDSDLNERIAVPSVDAIVQLDRPRANLLGSLSNSLGAIGRSAGEDVLSGDNGDNVRVGKNGRDQSITGFGSDCLPGYAGQESPVACSIPHERDSRTLDAVLGEWLNTHEHRRVIELHHLQGFSVTEVADLMGRTRPASQDGSSAA
jgi:hypothetical protein